MSERTQYQAKQVNFSPFTPAQTGLLQRTCACGTHAAGSGACAECSKEKQTLRRASLSAPGMGDEMEVPAIVQEVLRTPGQPLDAATRSFVESRFGDNLAMCGGLPMQRRP
jgi:hypothetical protein